MAQLVSLPLPIPEVHSSNLTVEKISRVFLSIFQVAQINFLAINFWLQYEQGHQWHEWQGLEGRNWQHWQR